MSSFRIIHHFEFFTQKKFPRRFESIITEEKSILSFYSFDLLLISIGDYIYTTADNKSQLIKFHCF